MTTHLLALYAQQHHAQIAQGMALLIGYFSSHVVVWTTHWSAPPKLKSGLAFVASVLAGTIASVAWAPGQPWYDWIKAIVFAIVASQSGYLLRHVPVIGAAVLEGSGLGLGAVPGAPDAPPPAVTAGVDPALVAPAVDPVVPEGGGVVMMLIGGVLVGIGFVLLLVAALAKPAVLSVPGLVLLLVGVIVLAVDRQYPHLP